MQTIDKDLDVLYSEPLPFSNLNISLLRDHDKFAFLIKNEASSRKLSTFDHKQHQILLLEMITDNLILAKVGNRELEGSYWTLMDQKGVIHEIPEQMQKILEI